VSQPTGEERSTRPGLACSVFLAAAAAVPLFGGETAAGHRAAPLAVSVQGRSGFSLIDSAHCGVRFTNHLSDTLLASDSSLMSGSGVALGDVDGDGWCDLYLCRLEGPNALFRNLGNWTFRDVTAESGPIAPSQISRGAAFADLDGDGDLDLLITARGGGVRAFTNDGRAHFTEVTQAAGLAAKTGSTSLALADIEGDGDLDLYVANFGVGSVLRDGGQIATRMVNGKPVVVGRMANRLKIIDGQLVEFGEPDVLYRNDGQGHFTPIPWESGAFLDEDGKPMIAPWDFGLAVQMRDLNGDGHPDIYVCNDFQTPDRIWINNGQGGFRATDRLAIRKTSYASMGVDFADVDRDGRLDGLVVEMLSVNPAQRLHQMTPDGPTALPVGRIEHRLQVGRNTLLWQRGDGTYAEIADYAGLSASDWSWMPVFLDVDLDGFEDVLIPNGHTHDLLDLDTIEQQRVSEARASGLGVLRFPKVPTPNRAFRNRGNLTFEEAGRSWGFDCPQVSNGLALADLDNDGDLDVVLNCLNDSALLYRNDSVGPRLAIRLKGQPPNTRGIGAQIKVLHGAVPLQSQEMIAGGRYLSCDDSLRVFAAGSSGDPLAIEVTWRSGRRSLVADVQPNSLCEIREPLATRAEDAPAAKDNRDPLAPTGRPHFQDVSELIAHSYVEDSFDDLRRQPSLPKRLSQPGPGVAWHDLDGDGHEDLIVGCGRGGRPSVFLNDGQGHFQPAAILAEPFPTDATGLVGCTISNRPTLLVGLSGYELSSNTLPAALQIELAPRPGRSLRTTSGLFNPHAASSGPLAVSDLDGDGDLDVFVGGRSIGGRYPEAGPSLLFRNEAGTLRLDSEAGRVLAAVGLVNGAVFSDLTGDGLPDLVLACEWGPIRVFQNTQGQFAEATRALGLADHLGWWQGVTTGDLDGDGALDLVAANWGLNSAYHCDAQNPVQIYSCDFDGDGVVEVLEATFDASANRAWPRRNWRTVGASLPWVLARFPSYRAFSRASIADILGEDARRTSVRSVNTLASTVFLRRGAGFQPQALPREAQWAPAFGVCVADFDGDGCEDVFLSQNFFGLPAETLRLDAGRGLWLRGDGRGRVEAVPGEVSGLKVYGEQRGCAAADYDGDGRLDLALTQNGAATRLYRNVGAQPGLRVRLQGPRGNPHGIGAQLRLIAGGDAGQRLGPVREIQAGSGYWSQGGSVQVLAFPEPATALKVRWPGGSERVYELPGGAQEVVLGPDGGVRTGSR
jgi:hypothetical protein